MRRATIVYFAVLANAVLPAAAADLAELENTPDVIAIQNVRFPHRLHFEDLEIECRHCHHETAATQLRIPHPEYFADLWIDCQTCHQAGPESLRPQECSSCHHAAPSDIADETLSAKVVVHRRCWSCHDVGTGAEASKSCRFCHPRTDLTGSVDGF